MSGIIEATNLQTANIKHTNGTTAATVASDGDITASADLTVTGAFTSKGIDDNADHNAITIDSNEDITILKQGYATTSLNFSNTNQGVKGAIKYDHASGRMHFDVHSAERMRIDADGKLLINTTSTLGSGQGVLHLKGATNNTVSVMQVNNNGEKGVDFRNASGTQVGHITINASATAFSTSSDYRLKENVDYTFDATTRLKQLKPARFNFIADADKTVDGFIAHEVSSIVPEAITGKKDAVDADGNPEYQGIDQSKLVPLLVKTIQELEARIKALEGA